MSELASLADRYPWDAILILLFVAYLCTEPWRW